MKLAQPLGDLRIGDQFLVVEDLKGIARPIEPERERDEQHGEEHRNGEYEASYRVDKHFVSRAGESCVLMVR